MKYIFITGFTLLVFSVQAQQSFEQMMDVGFEKYEGGDCAGAIEAYNQALQQEPKNAEAYYLRGVCKSLQEDNKEAVLDFDQAIKLNPEYAEAYFEKAFSLYILKENNQAIQFYTKALEIEPEYGEAYLNRGSVRHNNNDLEGACEDWTKAESLGMNIAYDLLRDNCMK